MLYKFSLARRQPSALRPRRPRIGKGFPLPFSADPNASFSALQLRTPSTHARRAPRPHTAVAAAMSANLAPGGARMRNPGGITDAVALNDGPSIEKTACPRKAVGIAPETEFRDRASGNGAALAGERESRPNKARARARWWNDSTEPDVGVPASAGSSALRRLKPVLQPRAPHMNANIASGGARMCNPGEMAGDAAGA